MIEVRRLNDVYDTWTTGEGIFNSMTQAPWYGDIGSDTLDIEFVSNYGNCFIAGFVKTLLSVSGKSKLDDTDVIMLSNYLYDKNKVAWNKLYELTKLEYNPVENYNRTETETITDSKTSTENNTYDKTLTETRNETNTANGSVNEEGTAKSTVDEDRATDSETNADSKSNVYGFAGGVTGVPDKSNNEHSRTVATDALDSTTTGTDSRDTTTSNTNELDSTGSHTGKDTEAKSGEVTGEANKESVIKGNIGVTTTQQMIQSEIDLWKWNFYDTIMEDVKNMICLQVM